MSEYPLLSFEERKLILKALPSKVEGWYLKKNRKHFALLESGEVLDRFVWVQR